MPEREIENSGLGISKLESSGLGISELESRVLKWRSLE
jgi:hypothetical protein